MMIKSNKFEMMRDFSPSNSLRKLRSLLLLEQACLGWKAGISDLTFLVLKEDFDSFNADEPWGSLGPKIFFNDLGDRKSSLK